MHPHADYVGGVANFGRGLLGAMGSAGLVGPRVLHHRPGCALQQWPSLRYMTRIQVLQVTYVISEEYVHTLSTLAALRILGVDCLGQRIRPSWFGQPSCVPGRGALQQRCHNALSHTYCGDTSSVSTHPERIHTLNTVGGS